MFVEFNNIAQGTAYYAVGGLDDLHALPYMRSMQFTDCGVEHTTCLERITEVINRLTDVEPGDSFQIRLFTVNPSSLVFTDRIMTHGVYWVNWNNPEKRFHFEKVDR